MLGLLGMLLVSLLPLRCMSFFMLQCCLFGIKYLRLAYAVLGGVAKADTTISKEA